jgi:putative exosortase-associated protein (TIGR04073 family)
MKRSAQKRVAWGLVIALAILAPSSASAAGYTAVRKLGRGFAGMTCGVMEVPGNMVKVTREKGPGYGFTLGFVEGLGMIVVRELVGVYEFVTAPIPAPAGYRPIIQPEYPWGYFER